MLTTLEAFFALGTFGFWILMALIGIAITALVENEEGIWATVVAIGTAFGLSYLWKINLISTIKANPGHILLYGGGYFALGAIWSVFKWYTYLHKANSRYEDYKTQFLAENKATSLTPELAAKLMDELGHKNQYRTAGDETFVFSTPPLARNHKSSLTRWATYWPFSIIGFALNDIVRKAWAWVIDTLQGTYQRISNHVFRNASADAKMAEEYKASAAAAGAGGSDDTSRSRRSTGR
jgi:hypothetical protein